MFVNGQLSGDESSDFDDIRVKSEEKEDSESDASDYGLVRIKNRPKRHQQPDREPDATEAVSPKVVLKRKRSSWEPWTTKENLILLICYADTHDVNGRSSKDYDKIHARYLEVVEAANTFSTAVRII